MGNTPAVPAAQSPRQVTWSEKQRFLADVWKVVDAKTAPAKLSVNSHSRVDDYAIQNYLDDLKKAFKVLFEDYQEAVRIQAEAYYKSILALKFEPRTPQQKTFDPLYLTWDIEPKSVSQRRQLVVENTGLGAVSVERTDFAAQEKIVAEKAQAVREHTKAVTEIEKAISGILFQGPFGRVDQAETDRVRADLKAYVRKNLSLSKSNGVKILRVVTESIAGAHQAYERRQTQWNSR